ncbi:cytochrome C oxidase subunit IV family protein [Mycolicibacterium flavescens]|uniref:Prokaryotic cytochrome C oxidase subunit IV family protein n=1 Tax=Mycolicibacterium flavescens TaxID=1776 RepID=A0A1E3RIK6_MYCFV|nr:cytochrome C oxidase subunit IV family protein [Mycolicibacterium flavescens]MCV7282127.1 cytochrome C oxidase subunit IV family protein [Mycolicibacterium flavescens]ODQ89679.1 prokaryotic cytochrome C oxidase subunit IV family protein [Mycolicibacterium flavescens]
MTETTGEARTMTWTWVVLTAITIGAWWLAPAHFTDTVRASAPITALVLVLTAVKVRLIFRNFMEVSTAPRWLRRSTDAWLGLLLVAVFVIYLV